MPNEYGGVNTIFKQVFGSQKIEFTIAKANKEKAHASSESMTRDSKVDIFKYSTRIYASHVK